VAGIEKNPLFDTNVNDIDDEFYNQNFRYKVNFTVDKEKSFVFLNFDAINWKARVFVNGTPVGRIDGAFQRARFDITSLLQDNNTLEVLIYANDTPGLRTYQGLAEGPGPNGGLLGADNPTLHASVGWDWLTTIPGRNIGIYGAVTLEQSGDIGIIDPWVETKLNLTENSSPPRTANNAIKPLWSNASDPWQLPLQAGEPYVIDLEIAKTIGSVSINWGSVTGGAAADLDVCYPAEFLIETSLDGDDWVKLDSFPGGEVEQMFSGIRHAKPQLGTPIYDGHATGERLQGGTAIIPTDLSMFGRGIVDMQIFAPNKARYVRLTAKKLRELNGAEVPCLIDSINIYSESSQELGQSISHMFTLDASSANLTFRAEVVNYSDKPLAALVGVFIQRVANTGIVHFSTERRRYNGILSLAPGERRSSADGEWPPRAGTFGITQISEFKY
jgi:hypothetical protein